MYRQFSLILTVTHACNMRCSYCYAGRKSSARMSEDIGCKSLDRAIASIEPAGELTLSFFGGEPLLQPQLIADLIDYARQQATGRNIAVRPSLTTNGTIDAPPAWSLM